MSSELVFFSAVDSNGLEGIWESNGAATGTFEIASLYGQPNEYFDDFVSINNVVLFAGQGPDGLNYLWVTDGTTQGTQPLDVANSSNVEGFDPTDLTVLGNEVYFNGIDAAGNYGLWVSNGTAAGTYEINGTSGLDPRDFIAYNGELVFTSIKDGGIWTVTSGGTVSEVAGTSGLIPENFTLLNGEVYFSNYGIASTNPYYLYETNATSSGTKPLGFIGAPLDMTAYGNQILYEAEDSDDDWNLYSYSNGSVTKVSGTTGIFDDLANSEGHISPELTVYDGYAYFEAESASGEFGLWRTNGSSATEITAISGTASGGVFPSPDDPDFNGPNFVIYNGELYFDGVGPGGEAPDFGVTYLWKSNGAASGTSIVSGIKGAGYAGTLGFDPTSMTDVTLPSVPAVTGVEFGSPYSEGANSISITGTVTPASSAKGVKIYNGSTLLGTASLSESTFSLSPTLSAGTYSDIQATVVDAAGQTVSQLAPFSITVGVTGKTYDTLIDEYNASRDLTGQVFYSEGNVYLQDTITSSYPSTTYSYTGGSYFEYTQYVAYNEFFGFGELEGTTFLYNGSSGSGSASYYETKYSAGNDFIGLQYIYTDDDLSSIGANYTGEVVSTDPEGDLEEVTYSGFSGTPYSSLTANYVGGVLSTSDYEFTSVAAGATYSSYEEIVNPNGSYAGADFFYNNITGQSYTAEEAEYNSANKLTEQVLSGFADEPYYSLELNYNAGVYSGYQAFYESTSKAFNGEQVDVSSAGALQKVIYYGVANATYYSVEQDYSSGAIVSSTYNFQKVSGETYYGYQVTENPSGAALQDVFDLNSGGHTQISYASGRTLTSLGNDKMTGSSTGSTTFDFAGIYGAGVITNMTSADKVIMPAAEFANFQQLFGAATQQGANVLITASDDDSLTLKNMTLSTLSTLKNNFSFE